MFCHACSQTLPNNEIIVKCCHCSQDICLHCFTSGVKQQQFNYFCCLCKNNYTINYIYNIISKHQRYRYVIDHIKNKILQAILEKINDPNTENIQNIQNNLIDRNTETELFYLITIINPYNFFNEVTNTFKNFQQSKHNLVNHFNTFNNLFDLLKNNINYNNVINSLFELKSKLNTFVNIDDPSSIELLKIYYNNQTNSENIEKIKTNLFQMFLYIEYKYYSYIALKNLFNRLNINFTSFIKYLKYATTNQTKYSLDYLQSKLFKLISVFNLYFSQYDTYFNCCGITNCIES